MPIQRLWCEGCQAPLPFRRMSDGTVEVKTEQCRERHPALLPPWFPVRLQQVKASEEHRGLDGIRPEDWEDKGIVSDPKEPPLLATFRVSAAVDLGALGITQHGPE